MVSKSVEPVLFDPVGIARRVFMILSSIFLGGVLWIVCSSGGFQSRRNPIRIELMLILGPPLLYSHLPLVQPFVVACHYIRRLELLAIDPSCVDIRMPELPG
jgi:hypothetical protein